MKLFVKAELSTLPSFHSSKSCNIPHLIKIIGILKYLLGGLLIKSGFSVVYTDVVEVKSKIWKVLTNPGHIEPGHWTHRREESSEESWSRARADI